MPYDFMQHLGRYGPHSDYACPTLAEADAYCRTLTRSHYENFSVAHRFLSPKLLPHLCSIYCFCRWADDLADEVDEPLESLELLNWWRQELQECFAGKVRHPVFVSLARSISSVNLAIEPFDDLISAFIQDQTVDRYETTSELLDYCQRSANPVGRLVLGVADCDTNENVLLSDRICTGLQLANFCQDVASDARRGRIYLSLESRNICECPESHFFDSRPSLEILRVIEVEVERARALLLSGRPLIDRVPKLIRKEVYLFVEGGLAILDRIQESGYDVLTARPRVGRFAKLRLLWKAWRFAARK